MQPNKQPEKQDIKDMKKKMLKKTPYLQQNGTTDKKQFKNKSKKTISNIYKIYDKKNKTDKQTNKCLTNKHRNSNGHPNCKLLKYARKLKYKTSSIKQKN